MNKPENEMLRWHQRIIELIEQKTTPTRDEIDKACLAYNKAVRNYLGKTRKRRDHESALRRIQ